MWSLSTGALLAAIIGATAPVRADTLADAAAAFDTATQRFNRREYAAAANYFESADRLSPSYQALAGAIRAHRQANSQPGSGLMHAVSAATLSLRMLERYPTNRRGTQQAQQLLNELSSRLARVTVECDACAVEVDGTLQNGRDFFTEPGAHSLTARWTVGEITLSASRDINSSAGTTESLTLERPPLPPPPPRRDRIDDVAPPPPPPPAFRFPMYVPIAAGGVAVGLTVAASVSWWVDALPKGNRLIQSAMAGTATASEENAVYAAENRTTVFVVSAALVGGFAIGSAFFTRWGRPRPAASTAQPTAWLRPAVMPTIVPGYTGMSLVGLF
jgi:hypothetical protein